jgi:hypothetical protein
LSARARRAKNWAEIPAISSRSRRGPPARRRSSSTPHRRRAAHAGHPIVRENGVGRTDGSTILGADDEARIATILEDAERVIEAGIPIGDVTVIVTICEEIGLLDPAKTDAHSDWVDSGQPVSALRFLAFSWPDHARTAPHSGTPKHSAIIYNRRTSEPSLHHFTRQ